LDDNTKKLYEGMFLVDAAEAVSNWEKLEEAVRKILSRNQAEVVSLKKWDERKLAYDIKGKSRGTYILCYFKADGESIAGIEKDVRLSERIMRVLILRVVPGMPGADVKESGPETVAAAESKAAVVESPERVDESEE
jgi:small subunit ribosomal protein S6